MEYKNGNISNKQIDYSLTSWKMSLKYGFYFYHNMWSLEFEILTNETIATLKIQIKRIN